MYYDEMTYVANLHPYRPGILIICYKTPTDQLNVADKFWSALVFIIFRCMYVFVRTTFGERICNIWLSVACNVTWCWWLAKPRWIIVSLSLSLSNCFLRWKIRFALSKTAQVYLLVFLPFSRAEQEIEILLTACPVFCCSSARCQSNSVHGHCLSCWYQWIVD